VDEVKIDVEQGAPVRVLVDDVLFPDFLEERFGHFFTTKIGFWPKTLAASWLARRLSGDPSAKIGPQDDRS
jgi:hypothetical protein